MASTVGRHVRMRRPRRAGLHLCVQAFCSASLWIVGFRSASLRTEGVCSASSGFEEPELHILDISQERGGFQWQPRCDTKPAPAHVELMPFPRDCPSLVSPVRGAGVSGSWSGSSCRTGVPSGPCTSTHPWICRVDSVGFSWAGVS